MTDLRFEPLAQDALAASAALDGTRLVLLLSGTADQRDTDFLDQVLANVHAEAVRLKLTEVAVDVRDLEFMNSTAFKALLSWITAIVGMSAGEQYQIRFLSDARHQWQRRSLEALRCFAVNLISVDT